MNENRQLNEEKLSKVNGGFGVVGKKIKVRCTKCDYTAEVNAGTNYGNCPECKSPLVQS